MLRIRWAAHSSMFVGAAGLAWAAVMLQCQSQSAGPESTAESPQQAYTLANPKRAMLNATTPPAATVATLNQNRVNAILLVFALGTDNQVWRWTQLGSGDTFVGPVLAATLPAGITAMSAPVAITSGFSVEVFVRGSDSGIYHATEGSDGSFTAWSSLSGWSNSAPAVALDSSGRVNVFLVGTDEGLWVNTETSSGSSTFGGWSAVGGRPSGVTGAIRSNPVARLRPDNRIDVFFRAGDGSLGFVRQNTAGSTSYTWNDAGGVLVGDPVPAGNRVYATSQVQDIWEATESGNGYTWAQVQPNPTGITFMSSPVTVGSDPAGVNNTVFVVASDRTLYHITRTSTSSFGPWTSDGSAFDSGLAVSGAGLPGAGTGIRVYGRGEDQALWFVDPAGSQSSQHRLGGAIALTSEDRPAVAPNVYTQRYDTNRTGANLHETVLNLANVNPVSFGKVQTISLPVNVPSYGSSTNYRAQVYAQPLYVSGLSIAGVAHNVLVVATQDNVVYAFDADTGATLWSRDLSLGGEFPVPVPNPDMGCFGNTNINIVGNQGITSTPVIDPSTQTLYVVDFSCNRGGQYCYPNVPPSCTSGTDPSRSFSFKIHSLNLLDGTDRVSSATLGQFADFNPKTQIQRPALLLAGGRVYVAFGSYADLNSYRGWVQSVSASNLGASAFFQTTRGNDTAAGIWMAGQGPAFDGTNLFLLTGNGHKGANSSSYYGSAFVRLSSDLGTAALYQPSWYANLDSSDTDLGSSGALIVPNTNFVVGGGKQGVVTVVDRTTMQSKSAFFGSYFPGGVTALNGPDGPPQNGKCTPYDQSDSHIHGSPVHWRSPAGDKLYLWGEVDYLKAFSLASDGTVPTRSITTGCCKAQLPTYGATGVSLGVPDAVFAPSHGFTPLPVECGMPGGMLSVSANGGLAGTAIVWAVHPGPHGANEAVWATAEVPGTLYALDAMDVSKELWDSTMNPSADDAGNFAKFSSPVVADGRVYILSRDGNGHGQVLVYGLHPSFNLPQ